MELVFVCPEEESVNTAERAASASWGPPPSFLESQHLVEAIKESPPTIVGALGSSQSVPSHLASGPKAAAPHPYPRTSPLRPSLNLEPAGPQDSSHPMLAQILMAPRLLSSLLDHLCLLLAHPMCSPSLEMTPGWGQIPPQACAQAHPEVGRQQPDIPEQDPVWKA